MKFLFTALFIIFLVLNVNSQNLDNREHGALEEFWDYSGWGFFVTPVIYQKSIANNRIGATQITGEPKYSFQLGAKRYFSRTFKWSFNTGVILNWIPSPDLSYDITSEIPEEYSYSPNENRYDGLVGVYVTVPLNMEYKQRLARNIYINFSTGLNIGLGSGVYASYNDAVLKEEQDENRKVDVFEMNVSSYDNGVILTGTLSAGFYFTFQKFMLQTNVIYNKNFKNLWQGEYSFSSLLNLGRTVGTYKQSGDYFGFSTTVFLKRKK